ncbi:transposase domain-containing protein, partial [Alicyclobacillus vulcanalis]
KTVDIVPNGTKLTDVTQYTQTVNLHLLTGHYRARASAVTYSIVETAKENGLNPTAYLKYLFERMPNMDLTDEVKRAGSASAALHERLRLHPDSTPLVGSKLTRRKGPK